MRIASRIVLLGAASAVIAAVGLAQTGSKAAGHWGGKMQMRNRELTITVDLAKNPNGVWIGSMSVGGTSAVDVPLDSVSVEDMNVRFAANLPQRISFAGQLSADADSLSGAASNADGQVPFQLARTGEADVKVPPPSSALSKEFEGTWEGTHETNGKVSRVGLKMWPAADGTGAATLVVVDEGNLEIPVTTVTVKGKDLQLEARSVSGQYRGSLAVGGEIAGEWSEATEHFPLTFKRVPPETKKP